MENWTILFSFAKREQTFVTNDDHDDVDAIAQAK